MLLVSSGHDRVVFFCDVYGYMGSNSNPGKLALTDQLFRFVFVEVDGACFGQLLTVACDFKAEPIKCLVFSRVLVLPRRKVGNWLPLAFRIISR